MEVYVREDAQIGDLVTTLTSVDQDEDKNADVTYAFISGKSQYLGLSIWKIRKLMSVFCGE